ncbi:MAG: hypothetical protein ACRDTG_17960 [Pseudonocardiaceae bacterium]
MTTNEITRLDLARCPACGGTAEVVDRFVLDSTDGPLEHVTTYCARRHRLSMLTEHLAADPLPSPLGKEPIYWPAAQHAS